MSRHWVIICTIAAAAFAATETTGQDAVVSPTCDQIVHGIVSARETGYPHDTLLALAETKGCVVPPEVDLSGSDTGSAASEFEETAPGDTDPLTGGEPGATPANGTPPPPAECVSRPEDIAEIDHLESVIGDLSDRYEEQLEQCERKADQDTAGARDALATVEEFVGAVMHEEYDSLIEETASGLCKPLMLDVSISRDGDILFVVSGEATQAEIDEINTWELPAGVTRVNRIIASDTARTCAVAVGDMWTFTSDGAVVGFPASDLPVDFDGLPLIEDCDRLWVIYHGNPDFDLYRETTLNSERGVWVRNADELAACIEFDGSSFIDTVAPDPRSKFLTIVENW